MNKDKLQKRLKEFSLNTLSLIKELPKTEENKIYGNQVLRSSSSIGANYTKAIFAHTRQDFLHTLNICRKETNETLYWLELISEVNKLYQFKIFQLAEENRQLLRIFISSVKTTKENSK